MDGSSPSDSSSGCGENSSVMVGSSFSDISVEEIVDEPPPSPINHEFALYPVTACAIFVPNGLLAPRVVPFQPYRTLQVVQVLVEPSLVVIR